MKSKELKTYNLPADDMLIYHIDAKPTPLFVISFMGGVFLLGTKTPIYYGLSLMAFSLIALIWLPKIVMMEFYHDYMVLYNRADKNVCCLIYYDEVNSWHYAWGANRDYLYIELVNGTTEKVEAFSRTLFESQMNRFMKEKRKKKS